jgi:hypothetical protein
MCAKRSEFLLLAFFDQIKLQDSSAIASLGVTAAENHTA